MNTIENQRKKIAVIGATGSVGSSVLSVCRSHADEIEIVGLAAKRPSEKLKSLASEFGTKTVLACDECGVKGLCELAESPEVDHVVFASSGTDAIPALQRALSAGKEVSLANKESVVVAGPWVMPLITRQDQLRPLDSEHNAIWQCLHGERGADGKPAVRRIFLTASGGPFRDWPERELKTVTPEMALRHPVWAMGAKITIDSATLMNKGIELIEAMFLFGLEPAQVDALISPGSFVHGLVEFSDGSVKMLAATPDMRLPAASCLFWPERRYPAPDFEPPLLSPRTVSFEPPDAERFPAMKLARYAMERKGPYPAALVGADEVAVERFLKGEIGFLDIARAVEEVLAACTLPAPSSLEEALDTLDWARRQAAEVCAQMGKPR
ncbi:MAG: 1-deoxy-D-xylulose-5-phosphate reductoisomerase [Synergistaceae bacterium]|nr:1-deoxy-D-xylulose-5-phosphate reductoisomerase [Synergistaceae bacterium]